MRFSLGLALLLSFTAGCGRKEEVRRYQAPKDPMWRMIGAVVPDKDATWFFKAVGPSDRLGDHKNDVLTFVRTLRAENGEVRWTLPAGWKEEASGPARVASFKFGDRDPKLELTVIKLPGDGGGLAANLNRWRDQLGLDRLGDAEISSLVQNVGALGVDAKVVDLTGPTRPSGGPRGMARPAMETPAPRGESPVAFDLPSGWEENPNPAQGRKMEFRVEDSAGGALVTLTAFPGDGGGLAPNIDRWRQQAGLEPLGEQAIARSATPIHFLGSEAWLVEAIGKDRGILGIIAITAAGEEQGKVALFLKMDGPAAVVTAQRGNFTRFAQSFRMRRRSE
jgi:hypothetical protein